MKTKALYTLLLVYLSIATASAQSIDTQVRLLDSNVKSLKIAPENRPYAPAIITLGGDERLLVEFDYLDYDEHYLRYSVIHCNADWQPSVLIESEYVDGFNEADIVDKIQSEGVFARYFHYNFTFPNEDFNLTKSGNYLLRVYEQDDPDKVLFQTRFALCENTVNVNASMTTRTDEDYNDRHQQLSFEVTYEQGRVRDPYNDLTAVVMQNSRYDNAVTLRRPLMVGTNKVVYDHMKELIFPAGNEYRRMELVNINNLNMGVARIFYVEPCYHADVLVDEPRASKSYLYDQTQYGHFTIRNADAEDSRFEAEYVATHFTLNTGYLMRGGTVHVQGEFTRGLPFSSTRMNYDEGSGCYTASFFLKQGAYNYQYLWLPDGATQFETAKIEGDKYETRNEYLITIYNRSAGERYDHLVAFTIQKPEM